MQSSFSIVSHELLSRLNPKGEHKICYLAQFHYGKPQFNKAYTITAFHSGDHLLYYLEKLKPEIFVIYQSPAYLQKFSQWQVKKIKETSRLVVYTPIEGTPISYDVPLLDAADLILVPSFFSQKCLQHDGYESKILYHGVDGKVFKPRKNWEQKFEEPNPFTFSCVASHVWRKQLTRIIDAYQLLLTQRVKANLKMVSTTYDATSWLPNLKRYIKKKGIPNPLSETAYLNLTVSKRTMAKLYNNTHCHLQPSSEAFGLTALEALSCGNVPIIVGHGGSPEVVGDCGLYASIESFLTTSMGNIALVNTRNLAQIMKWATENPKSLLRLAKKGIERAKTFTWERTAQQLEKYLDELV